MTMLSWPALEGRAQPVALPSRRLRTLLVVLLGLLLGLFFVTDDIQHLEGDGVEYLTMSQGVLNRLDPRLDRHDPAELIEQTLRSGRAANPGLEALSRPAPEEGYVPQGYFKSKSGAYYSYHFWLYSALNAPALLATKILGVEPQRSFLLTNGLACLATVWTILGCGWLGATGRVALLAFYLLGGLTFYLDWPGPEVLVVSATIVGLLAAIQGRWGSAGWFLALATQHAPPIGLLAAPALGLGALKAVVERPRGGELLKAGATLAGAALILVSSPLFYMVHFGVPNLIQAVGAASWDQASASRLLALFWSPDQGMVRALPWLFVVTPILAGMAVQRRDRPAIVVALGFVAAVVIMALPTLATVNWNHGCRIINRYAYWLTAPLGLLLAYLAQRARDASGGARTAAVLVALFALGQGGVVVADHGAARSISSNSYGSVSKWLLAAAPQLYNPVPATFIERGLPPFIGEDREIYELVRAGRVTKILFHRDVADMRAQVCGRRLTSLLTAADMSIVEAEHGWVYVHPKAPCETDLPDGVQIDPRAVARGTARLISVGAGGAGVAALGSGWSAPEPWGTWSDGLVATLQIDPPRLRGGKTRLSLEMSAYAPPGRTGQRVRVTVAGSSADLVVTSKRRIYDIVLDAAPRTDRPLIVRFELPDARSPAALEGSTDRRRLGIGLWSYELSAADEG